MFGFLYVPERTCSSEVKSVYQSLFCGLSCQLRSDYGVLARFLVNRDSTFLALVGDAVAHDKGTEEMKTCCNPFSKKKAIVSGGSSLEYASAISMCALATKLEDNVADDHGWKKYASACGHKAILKAKDYAVSTLNGYGFPTRGVTESMAQQNTIDRMRR